MIDVNHAIRTIRQAEEVHKILEGMKRHQRAITGPKVQTSASRTPVDLGMLDLADDIKASLQGWARLVEEETGETLDDLRDMDVVGQWLRVRATWIAGANWAEDMLSELSGHTRRAIGMLGLLPARMQMPEPCDCGAEQWLYHERPPFVRCKAGHLSGIVSHLQGRGVESVSQMQAAWVLGCSQQAVSRRIKRGTLHSGADGGVLIASLRDTLAKDGA